MTAYRQETCAFCELGAAERCPRCQVMVCSTHGLAGGRHCAVCAKELKDDIDVASFGVAVHDVPPDSGGMFRSRRSGLADLFDAISRAVRARSARRRAQRAFDARTLPEIAEWRRTAGVRMRG